MTAELKDLVCPPYDVISPQEQDRLHAVNPHNFIHILLGKDIPGEDKYRRAQTIFKNWLKDSTLTQEEKPAIYFYLQNYNIRGEKKTRLGFIALMHLGEKEKGAFTHENTRLAPKEDRFKLMKQVKANLSPIFIVFADHKRIIQRTYEKYIKDREPFAVVTDNEKTLHCLWKIDDPEVINNFQVSLAKEDLFIADGHHRYEVASNYRDLMKEKASSYTGEESYNYILTYFTNTDPHGLSILPIHRLLKFKITTNQDELLVKLKEYFEVEPVKDRDRFLFLLEKGGRSEHLFGMYLNRKYWLLRLKNVKILDGYIKDKPKEYRTLDVAILNQLVFKNILDLSIAELDDITYGHNAIDVMTEADKSSGSLAFIMNPVRVDAIIALALKGEKMPPKSTFFYPKVLSGLVIHKHEEA
jgi:uncharacterized protein (DUF1015 family)